MDTLMQLQQRFADLVGEAKALHAAAEDGRLTEEAAARDDEIQAELDALTGDIRRAERQRERERQLDAGALPPGVRPAGPPPGDPDQFASLGEQLQAVHRASMGDGVVDPRLQAAASGASEGVPSEGGFLVQQDFSSEIFRVAHEGGQILSRVRRVPISGMSNGLKIPAIDETSRVAGSRWGGIQMYWAAEAAALTGSQPTFRMIQLDLKKLTGLMYMTDELMQDAAALDSLARQAFAEELTFNIERAIIEGTGAGEPKGIKASGAIVTVAKEGSQAASTIVAENIVKMWSRCHARSRQNAVWLINQDIEPQLYLLALGAGDGRFPLYMPPGGLSAAPFATIMGRPVIAVEHAETLGTAGDITLADFGQYMMIDKGAPRQDVSMHVRFLFDEGTFRIIYRADGAPLWEAPLTPAKGNKTLSPFVNLATRA